MAGSSVSSAALLLARAVQVISCYQAGRGGFWLHRFLIRQGIDNRVLDSASMLVDCRARRAKTDRLDAAALLRLVMARALGSNKLPYRACSERSSGG